MICITLNDQKKNLETNTTLKEALAEIEDSLKPFAVALNKHFIPHGDYETIFLKEGDEIETVTPMQGG